LNVTQETIGPRQVVLRIEPEQRDVDRAMRRVARQVSKYRPMAGFRPGKAPYGMVLRAYGKEFIVNEALNDMAPDIYRQAIDDQELEPYSQGQFEIESADEPIVLKFTVDLMPTVDLGDYASLSIDPEPEVAITEEQIDQEVEAVQRRNAEMEPVERPVAMGDQIVAAVKGVDEDGQDVIDQEDATIEINDDTMPPGFAEAVIGMTVDDTREFSLTYPEDYETEDLADKAVSFDITVKTVREVVLPEIDDDLAKSAGDYENLAEMREGLAENLKSRLENEARQAETTRAIEALVELANVDYPQAALDDEIESMVNRQRDMLQQMGFELGNYLRMTGSSEQEFRESLVPGAQRQILERLVLSEYARAAELEVDAQELEQQVQMFTYSMAMRYGDDADRQMRNIPRDRIALSLYGDILVDKARQRLTEVMTGRYSEEEESDEIAETEDTDAAVDETVAEDAAPKADAATTEAADEE